MVDSTFDGDGLPEGGAVKTGVSETSSDSTSTASDGGGARSPFDAFDEHERDTAQRAYPKEIVDGTKRTTKMSKLDLAALRTESGTRPALTHDAIERHVRARMEDALAEVERVSGIEVDPHSRPTIAAGFSQTMPAKPPGEWSPDALAASTTLPLETPPMSRPTPLSTSVSLPMPERSPIPGRVVGFILFGLLFLVSAAGGVGFFLGRRSARHAEP